ncbi:hypothetical protein EGW08_010573 [Elysia chlorotica]|uniref:C-type lectin domain-containing protein n=1 Tax=Elysia chlorotica TaxID=188477 RepID=A0A3S0ZSI1_ELYCH|nr:hypothetical protein EGW08_010573 [Elysia chlorotica]
MGTGCGLVTIEKILLEILHKYCHSYFYITTKDPVEADAHTNGFYFDATVDAECTKSQLSLPWTAQNEVSCIAQCKSRHQDECRNVVFNPQSDTCTPVHPTPTDQPGLTSAPGDVLYSQGDGRVLDCDTAAGFRLFQKCGAAACLLPVLIGDGYISARSDCTSRGALMFAPDSAERFALLQAVVAANASFHTYMWVGLTKFGGVNSWSWESGRNADNDLYKLYMWASGQPDNNFMELCAGYSYMLPQKLMDMSCSLVTIYFCEQNY